MTSSPRDDWLTYRCRLDDTMTVSSHGFNGSETQAWSGCTTSGVRTLTISMIRGV